MIPFDFRLTQNGLRPPLAGVVGFRLSSALAHVPGDVTVSIVARGGIVGFVLRFARRLRFPYLFALTAIVFVIDLFVPDAVPFADEIVIGLVTVLLGSIRKRQDPANASKSPAASGPK